MFTGIVKGTAIVKSILKPKALGLDTRMTVLLGEFSSGLKIGDSVSINGTCLTVTKLEKGSATFEIVKETIDRTTFDQVKEGDSVNVERSLMLKDRLEGHLVLGHIDGVGEIIEVKKASKGMKLWIKAARTKMKHIVPKGSVTIDGISLTVVDVRKDKFSVALVPHTLHKTTIAIKSKGDRVNIEYDILSKYVDSLLPQKT